MNEEQRYQIFQIRPGKPPPVYVNPDDPKDINAIRACLTKENDCCNGEPPTHGECPICGCREGGNASFVCAKHYKRMAISSAELEKIAIILKEISETLEQLVKLLEYKSGGKI